MTATSEDQRLSSDGRLAELTLALRREERISGALREVGVALGTTFDLDDLLELILSKLKELVDAERAALYLLDEAKNELLSRLVVGGKLRSIRIKVGHGIAGAVAQTGKPIRIRDAYADPRFERDWDLLTGYRTQSVLAAPLKNHLGRTIGVIQVLNKASGGEFTSEDEAILSALSVQAAVAIDNSRLFLTLTQRNKQLIETKDLLERKLQELSLLFELERATARSATPEELSFAVLSQCAEVTQARGAALLLAHEESRDLVQYVYDAEKPAEPLLALSVKANEGFLGAALTKRAVLSLESAAEHEHYSPRVEGKFPFPVTTVLAVPLDADEAPLGAIGLFSRAGGAPFLTEDADLMQLVSANVSTAVRLFNANRARERSERLTTIGRLLSQVIHDFKTPMAVISGYVQLMADAEDPQVRAEYAEEALKQFDTLTTMQREVLEFARGERTIFLRRVYLKNFFADLERQLKLEVGNLPIELKVEVDSKLVARFDEARVARAVHNLARNAREAMGEHGGRLTVTAALSGEDLVIRVSDTGPGIPKELECRLFQSFVTQGKSGGTGLGLAIVKKIVEEHGGRVEVESSGSGATFTLYLPQASPKSPQDPRRVGGLGRTPRALSKGAPTRGG